MPIQVFVLLLLYSAVTSNYFSADPYRNQISGNRINQKTYSTSCSVTESGWSEWIPKACFKCGLSRYRYCQGSYDGCGDWYCLGNSVHYCDDKCPKLQPVDSRIQLSTDSVGCGTTVRFSCPACYTVAGRSSSVQCSANQTWIGDIGPTCKHVSCPEPYKLLNGYRTWGSNCDSKAVFRCYSGYELIGPTELTCTSRGIWLPAQIPMCIPKKCPYLIPPQHGFIIVFSRAYRSRAYFRCRMGYDLHGYRSVRCGSTGVWSGSVPACVRSPNYSD